MDILVRLESGALVNVEIQQEEINRLKEELKKEQEEEIRRLKELLGDKAD